MRVNCLRLWALSVVGTLLGVSACSSEEVVQRQAHARSSASAGNPESPMQEEGSIEGGGQGDAQVGSQKTNPQGNGGVPGSDGVAGDGMPGSVPGDGASQPAPACTPTQVRFARDVWLPVVKRDCGGCHITGGYAAQNGSTFVLEGDRNPDYLKLNAERLLKRRSMLLPMISGQAPHGGGVRFTAGTPEYQAIEEFIARADAPAEDCGFDTDPRQLQDDGGMVAMLPPALLLRKLSLQLEGRFPTAAEFKDAEEKGMPAVDATLTRLMESEGFLDWVRMIYNEQLLTDMFLGYTGSAINGYRFKNYRYFERVFANGTQEMREHDKGVHYGTGREALELIKYIVRRNKPFTEILTADYMMVNGYSARAFLGDSHTVKFTNPLNPFEFVPAQIPLMYGHAGLLTSHSLLQRFSTTESNRNRRRARMIYKAFLDTDIMELAARSAVDLTAAADPQSPVLKNLSCVGCHSLIDPVASAYQNYYDTGLWTDRYGQPWHKTMLPPGFEAERMAAADVPRATRWLAERIAKDPRFAASTVRRVFTGLMGQPPLKEPADSSPKFQAELQAFLMQRQVLAEITRSFIASNYNFKALVRALAMSPYYRGDSILADAPAEAEDLLDGFARGRRRFPEEVDRSLSALTGQKWIEYGRPMIPTQQNNYLFGKPVDAATDYNLLLGGIDSDAITEFERGGHSIKTQAEMQVARKVACKSVVHDFALPADKRTMFPLVGGELTPQGAEAQAQIKNNIRYLHYLILGEDVSGSQGEAEVQASYDLFMSIWTPGFQRIKSNQRDATFMPYDCHLTNYDEFGRGPAGSQGPPGGALPDAARVMHDRQYVMRAWMAVVSTLLADYRFYYD